MRPTTKWQIIIGTFALCWLLYFIMPHIGYDSFFAKISNLSGSEPFNFIFLMLLFLMVSLVFAEATEWACKRIRRFPRFRPRLGEVLLQGGFISSAELDDALDEQKLRIGDVLLQAGKLAPSQLDQALDYQQSLEGIRVGEALVKLGYVSSEDVFWALGQSNRKLGRILVDRGLIAEYDLHRMLGWMGYSRDHGLGPP